MARSTGASSDHTAAAACWPSPASRATRPPSTSAPSTAACGAPPTPGSPGIPCSTGSRSRRSARWSSPPPIRGSFTSAPAKLRSARTSPTERASTSPATAARRGTHSASRTRATSARCSSTRRTRTSCWLRRWATRTAPTPSAACSGPPTGAARGARRSSGILTPGRSIWPPIRGTRGSCTRRCGKRGARRGNSTSRMKDPGAGCTSRATAERPGRRSPATACQRDRTGASASRWAAAGACTRSSAPSGEGGACTAPTTPARRGSWPAPTLALRAATGTSVASRWTRRTATSCTCPTSPCSSRSTAARRSPS